MARPETITMRMRELDRLKAIQALAEGRLTASLAADRLELTWPEIGHPLHVDIRPRLLSDPADVGCLLRSHARRT